MKVNFNNLRLQTAFALDDVIRVLNQNTHSNKDGVRLNDDTWFWCEKAVFVDVEDLQKSLDTLRSNVGVICACYEDGNEDVVDVSGELEANGGLGWFNPEE